MATLWGAGWLRDSVMLNRVLVGCIAGLLLCQPAMASDMGNGPAAMAVWSLGGLLSLVVSWLVASEKDEHGGMGKMNVSKFFLLVFVAVPLVFFAGLFAAFI